MFLLGWLMPASAVTFATDRLQVMAQYLDLQLPDTLFPGYVTTYSYKGHPLRIGVNERGEVCHIGLRLFADDLREQAPSPVYDFLERDFLERQLTNYDGALKHLLLNEHLSFLTGDSHTCLKINGTEDIQQQRVDFRSYRLTWSRRGKTLLDVVFDMDYQMLSGCNALELERRYLDRLKHFKADAPPDPNAESIPSEGTAWIAGGDSLYIKEMNNSVYYERKEDGWQLVDSSEKPVQTLANMLLSPWFGRDVTLRLTVKSYTYEDKCLEMPYKTWLLMAAGEGCEPYFGIKYKTEAYYEGTVILANRLGGYAHLLSVSVPKRAIQAEADAVVEGRLYLYIPLHSVTDQYFKK